jgi:hypothetical protein
LLWSAEKGAAKTLLDRLEQPYECLHEIFSLINDDEPARLPGLCLLCRYVQPVARRILWRHVSLSLDLTHGRPWGKELRYQKLLAASKKASKRFYKVPKGAETLAVIHAAIEADPRLASYIEHLDVVMAADGPEDAAQTERGKIHGILSRMGHLTRLSITDEVGVLEEFLAAQTAPFFPRLIDATVSALSQAASARFLHHAPALQCFDVQHTADYAVHNGTAPDWPATLPSALEVLHSNVSYAAPFWTPLMQAFGKTVRVLQVAGRNLELLSILPGAVESLTLGPFDSPDFLVISIVDIMGGGLVHPCARIKHLELVWGSVGLALGSMVSLTALESCHISAEDHLQPEIYLKAIIAWRNLHWAMQPVLPAFKRLTVTYTPSEGAAHSPRRDLSPGISLLQYECDVTGIHLEVIDLRGGELSFCARRPILTCSGMGTI